MSVKWRGKQGARRGMGGKSSINLSIVFGFWAGVNSQEQRRPNPVNEPAALHFSGHCLCRTVVDRWISGYSDRLDRLDVRSRHTLTMFATFCWWLIAGGVGNDRHGPREPLEPLEPGGAVLSEILLGSCLARWSALIGGQLEETHPAVSALGTLARHNHLLSGIYGFSLSNSQSRSIDNLLTAVSAMECWHFRNTS